MAKVKTIVRRIPAKSRKSKLIAFRASRTQKAAIALAAKAKGKTMSQYLIALAIKS